ncbi:uncharacterized protein Eint_081620 [Encephalitozoon intestinalis ATCC 50506]|uniref:Uncharacterized protein n=1 Tax=Encephalitozoon intestinalis (strain ATCC 50506) TaxID=876142 RepID=E0S8Q6_ENCIT|nr:uncharacterized protein Eint_081620 [Encephalitozoon intestinalis ATCC 50506]ADM12094.1 hypothetical protein Eint_081620 [Encephalitozoon intestinalis ATCC 50506]UTX45887.1 hypothetical protein GPK93_08g14660 [Encephalitozoon intestinalis]
MDIEKKISSMIKLAGKKLEDFRYMASIALNFLECFLYSFVGIICLIHSYDPIKSELFKYVSCILIAMGVVDGLHKIPTTYLIKTRKKASESRIIRWLERFRRALIGNKINEVIDFFGIFLMIFAISVMISSIWINITSLPSDNQDFGAIAKSLFCSSGLYSLLSLLYSLYNLFRQGYEYIVGFQRRETYSNSAGVVIIFEDSGKELHGADKEPFSKMPVITLPEVVFMLIFIIWGFIRGGSSYMKKTLTPTFVILRVSTTILQYMVPFFRYSGNKNLTLFPIIFISLLSFSSYISGPNKDEIKKLLTSTSSSATTTTS